MGSDLAIALAYFAIPLIMIVVLRGRRDDIPYPWLWTLFVIFIVACGTTHVVHVWSALVGAEYLRIYAFVAFITAIASVGTALAFAVVLPQIKLLPSPQRQKAELESLVASRTAEKDMLIRELNHRVGNQLQLMVSFVNVEKRRAQDSDTLLVLERLRLEIEQLNARHLAQSQLDFLNVEPSPSKNST